jgi:hypothetical protein
MKYFSLSLTLCYTFSLYVQLWLLFTLLCNVKYTTCFALIGQLPAYRLLSQGNCYCRGYCLGRYRAAAMHVFSFTALLIEFVSCSSVWQFYMCSSVVSDAP